MGPFGTRSGYGDHARDIFHSFHESNKYDIVVWDTRWGDTPRNALNPKNDKDKLNEILELKPHKHCKKTELVEMIIEAEASQDTL